MEPVPLPSRVHYELLLQLLERKTLAATSQTPMIRAQVQQLIITLRKALAQQKQLEAICGQTCIPFDHRWSLNSINVRSEESSDPLSTQPTVVKES